MGTRTEIIEGLEALRDPLAEERQLLELLSKGEREQATVLAQRQAERDHENASRAVAIVLAASVS